MKILIAMFSLFAVASAAIASEMYKCTVDGRTSFQEVPCLDKKSGDAVIIRKDSPTRGEWEVSTEKMNREIGDRIKARDLTDDIDRAYAQLTMLNGNMERELSALRAKRLFPNNNLASATWENSISAEMNVVTASYSNKIRSLEVQIDSLRKQRDRYLPK